MHLVDRFNSSRSTFRRTQLKLREKEKKQRNDIQVGTFWKNVQHNEIFCKINEVTVTYYQQKLNASRIEDSKLLNFFYLTQKFLINPQELQIKDVRSSLAHSLKK